MGSASPQVQLTWPRVSALARQPILDARDRIVAYELLYRGDTSDTRSGRESTARVLIDAISAVGFDIVVGDKLAFVNFDADLITEIGADLLATLPVVVEVLETVDADDEVVSSLKFLKSRGVRVALDDFQWGRSAEALLPLADYVKLDVRLGLERLEQDAALLRDFPWVVLLAEKVETFEERDRCARAGCQLFQGYYYMRPEPVRSAGSRVGQTSALRLLAALADPAIEARQVSEHVRSDAGLTYKVLKFANSAMYRRTRSVRAVEDAVAVLGIDLIRQWASILCFANLSPSISGALLDEALLRAHLCEALARRVQPREASSWFLLGLLSALDRIVEEPIERIVTDLRLSPDLAAALLHGDGAAGEALHFATRFSDGTPTTRRPVRLGIAPDDVDAAFREGLRDKMRFRPDTAGDAGP
jgi:EAL and modified HD-GYP domain-containing signal transduction protein